MNRKIAQLALVVADYDEAISFYTKKLKFELVEDTPLSQTKRWVVVRPKGEGGCQLLLAKAADEEQRSRVGNQTGGRVFLFLYTDDFDRDYQDLLKEGVEIIREPSVETYGKVAVFADLYGNWWDLIEPSPPVSPPLLFEVRVREGSPRGDLYELEQTTYHEIIDQRTGEVIMTFEGKMEASLSTDTGLWGDSSYSGVSEISLSPDHRFLVVNYFDGKREEVPLPE